MKKNWWVVIVCFVLLLIATFMFYPSFRINLTGKVIDNMPIENNAYCQDSDGGIFSSTKGVVTIKNFLGVSRRYADKCQGDLDGKEALREYYCENGKVKWQKIACEKGCVDGTCVERSNVKNSIVQEGCYLQFNIEENKNGNESEFSLASVKNIYGAYDHFVRTYVSGEDSGFVLMTFDDNENTIGAYTLTSSRFLIGEDFSQEYPKWELIELDEGIIESVIPYDLRIKKAIIYVEGKSTDLHIDSSTFECKRTCSSHDEEIDLLQGQCCSGLIPSEQEGGRYVCIPCGDGVCSSFESKYSCLEDCKG